MDSERDVTHVVRSWLREDGHESADRVLDDVLAMLDTNAQRPGAWSMRRVRTMNSPRRLVTAAAVAVAIVAVVGGSLVMSFGGFGGPGTSTSPAPAATTPAPADQVIHPGTYEVPWSHGRLRLTMPAGWWSTAGTVGWPAEAGTTITRSLDGPNSPILNLDHDVTSVVTDVCVEGGLEDLKAVGPTVEDLATALANQVGVRRSGPTDVLVGGYQAKKFVLTMPSDDLACPGPEGKRVWANATTNGLELLKDGTTTIYVIDVNGDRLVITSLERGASAADIAQLDAIVASIEIQHEGVTPACVITGASSCATPRERIGLSVEGTPMSLIPAPSWGLYGRISLNESIVGPQAAEGIVYWTTFPDGTLAHPCANLSGLGVGASAADLAAAVSTAPGTELVAGPSDVTVGGRPAKHVVVIVRERLGCDPGYFFTWHDYSGGALWSTSDVGDTIRAWIVDVNNRPVLIVGETHAESRPGFPLPEVYQTRLDDQIQEIVDSIQFK